MQINNAGSNTPPATIDEIFAYLDQFNPKQCDFCGNKTWTVMLNAHGFPCIVDHNQYAVISSGGAYLYTAFAHANTEKCILVRCQNCGQVKQFSYGKLMDWVVCHRKSEVSPA